MNKLELFLETREDALIRGDRSVVMAMNAELDRLGWKEPEDALERHEMVHETTQMPSLPERAVPPKPRGPRPRCEHGMIPDRCATCLEELPESAA